MFCKEVNVSKPSLMLLRPSSDSFVHLVSIKYTFCIMNLRMKVDAQILEKSQPSQILTHVLETFIRNLIAPSKPSQKYSPCDRLPVKVQICSV